MKRRIIVLGIVAAAASGCASGGTSGGGSRTGDDIRNTRVDTPRDSQGQGGAADMPGKGRGSEPHHGKH